MNDLLAGLDDGRCEPLSEGAVILRGFARSCADELLATLKVLTAQSPFRRMVTPSGHRMSVLMTNCGEVGWVTDLEGYRYVETDPQTGQSWPDMPASYLGLAQRAAELAGFPGFNPDGCLINRYEPGSKLSLHQDKDEADLRAPVVSVSLGLPAKFLWGGMTRRAATQPVLLDHGDVMVWGGPSRLRYHAIQSVKEGFFPDTGHSRIALTFRRVRPQRDA